MKVKVIQSCPTLCDLMDSPWNSPGQNTGVGKPFPSPEDLPNPGIEPRDRTQVSCIAGGSLPAEPQRKPKNTGVGSLSLLQQIFPTQGLELRSSALQADSLPAEPQGKPKNTGVGSLSLLQGIFLVRTKEKVGEVPTTMPGKQ